MLPSSGGPMGRDGGYYAETMNHMIDEFTESGDCHDMQGDQHAGADSDSPLGFGQSATGGGSGPDAEVPSSSLHTDRFSVRQTELAVTVGANISALEHDGKGTAGGAPGSVSSPPGALAVSTRNRDSSKLGGIGRGSRDGSISGASSMESPLMRSAKPAGGDSLGAGGAAPLRASEAEGSAKEAVVIHCAPAGGSVEQGATSGTHRSRDNNSACGAFLQRPSRYISAGANAGNMAENGGSLAHDERERGPFGQRARLRTHVIVRIHRGVHRIMELQVAEVLRLIQAQCTDETHSRSGILTYRDCRQAFTDVHPIPSIEIRRHVILVCLPPVTCFILKDTIYVLVTEDLRADELIFQLCKLSRYYAMQEAAKENLRLSLLASDAPQKHSGEGAARNGSGLCKSNFKPIGAQGGQQHLQTSADDKPANALSDLSVSCLPGPAHSHTANAGVVSTESVHDPIPLRQKPKRRSGGGVGDASNASTASSDSSSKLPFEFAALECIFFAAFQQLNAGKFGEAQHRTRTKGELLSLLMEDLHALREPIALYQDRVDAFDKAFDELISNNAYLQRMELSKYAKHPNLYDEPPEKEVVNPDLEILLEYFDQEIDQFKIRVRHLKGSIDDSERLLTLRLAVMRNSLIKSELAATLLGAGLAVGTSISGIFGMNLENGREEGRQGSHEVFVLVSCVVALTAIFAFLAVIYLVKTIRL